MKRFVELGFYISFAGPITYPPKKEICDYEEVIRQTPLDRIMADTDSPYVAPVPHRGKRNEPLYVKAIIKKIAESGNEIATHSDLHQLAYQQDRKVFAEDLKRSIESLEAIT
jgi:TatD DNase family protein